MEYRKDVEDGKEIGGLQDYWSPDYRSQMSTGT